MTSGEELKDLDKRLLKGLFVKRLNKKAVIMRKISTNISGYLNHINHN
jgi:hypothetical protein